MVSQADVRRIASELGGAIEAPDRFAFSVEHKGKSRSFAWVWLERVHPKKARVPQPAVLAVRVAGELEKASLLSVDPAKFFTEPHYHGYPAVLVRLAAVSLAELRPLLENAWRCVAPAERTTAPHTTAAMNAAARRTAAKQPAAKRAAAKQTAAKQTAAKQSAAKRTAAATPAERSRPTRRAPGAPRAKPRQRRAT